MSDSRPSPEQPATAGPDFQDLIQRVPSNELGLVQKMAALCECLVEDLAGPATIFGELHRLAVVELESRAEAEVLTLERLFSYGSEDMNGTKDGTTSV